MKIGHLLFFTYLVSHTLPTSPLNLSHLLHSTAPQFHNPKPLRFLQDVLKEIAERKKWDVEAIRILSLDKVRFGYTSRNTFFARVGNSKKDWLLRYSDKVNSWQELEVEGNFEQLVDEVTQHAVLPPFKIEGPFVLFLDGVDDWLSLHLPSNTSFSGLRQIRVGEGITVEITGAQEVTFPLSFCKGNIPNGTSGKRKDKMGLLSLEQRFCAPLLPIRVLGSAHVCGFSSSTIEHKFVAKGVAKLRQHTRDTRHIYRKHPCPEHLSSRTTYLKHHLSNIFGEKFHLLSFHKTIMKASTIVQLHLELERDVRIETSKQGRIPDWRTLPAVQRVWFDIVATRNVKTVKLLAVKEVRPFVDVYSVFSNTSVSELSSVLVRPRPLTLDIRW